MNELARNYVETHDKVVIEMTMEHYDGLLRKMSQHSPVYATLKSGVVDHPLAKYPSISVIYRTCDVTQAWALLR